MKRILIPATIVAASCFVPGCRSHSHNATEHASSASIFDSVVLAHRFSSTGVNHRQTDSLAALIDSPVIMCITRDSTNGRFRFISFSARQISLGSSSNTSMSMLATDTAETTVSVSTEAKTVYDSTTLETVDSRPRPGTRILILVTGILAAFSAIYILRRHFRLSFLKFERC